MTPPFGWGRRDQDRKDSESPQSPEAEVEARLADAAANSRVIAVTEELIGRVLRLRQAEAMIGELDDAIARLRRTAMETGGGPDEPPGGGEPGDDISLPTAAASAPGRWPRGRGQISEGLRLVVLQLASAGESHDEIATRLESDFSVVDAEAVVDAVLDAESSPGARSSS